MGVHPIFNTNASMLDINEEEFVMSISKKLIVEVNVEP